MHTFVLGWRGWIRCRTYVARAGLWSRSRLWPTIDYGIDYVVYIIHFGIGEISLSKKHIDVCFVLREPVKRNVP